MKSIVFIIFCFFASCGHKEQNVEVLFCSEDNQKILLYIWGKPKYAAPDSSQKDFLLVENKSMDFSDGIKLYGNKHGVMVFSDQGYQYMIKKEGSYGINPNIKYGFILFEIIEVRGSSISGAHYLWPPNFQ